MAVLLEQLERVAGQAQVEETVVRSATAEDLGVESGGEAHHGARLRALAGAHVGPDLAGAGQHALDQRLDRAAAGLGAVQAGLDDLGVVEHQQVAGIQQIGQFAEHAVDGRIGPAVEQTRGAAFRGGVLGDEVGRQSEIEIGKRRKARMCA